MTNLVTVEQQFGFGVVLDPDVGRDGHGFVLVRLRCDPAAGGCGAIFQTSAARLRSGKCRSCGCLLGTNTTPTNGLKRHPLYNVWHGMLQRCENPGNRSYPDYGGRGITVYGPWHDVARFIADVEAEIGPRPLGRTPGGKPLYTLDRVNSNSGYRPGNVKWSTWPQQRRNRRNTVAST